MAFKFNKILFNKIIIWMFFKLININFKIIIKIIIILKLIIFKILLFYSKFILNKLLYFNNNFKKKVSLSYLTILFIYYIYIRLNYSKIMKFLFSKWQKNLENTSKFDKLIHKYIKSIYHYIFHNFQFISKLHL
jgi:hypothetical protein